MPTEVSEAGPLKRRLKISIPGEKVREALDSTWKEARQSIRMKGFRPGKVPQGLLERKYGRHIQDDVKQNLIQDAYREALREHRLKPVRHPAFDAATIALDAERGLDFELVIELRPEFDLAEYKGVAVAAPALTIGDEHVAQEIEHLRVRNADVEEVTEGVAAQGDYLKADVSYQVDGAIVLHHDDVTVDTKRGVVDGVPAEAALNAFSGKGVGATVAVPVTLPGDFEPAGFAGAEARLLATVKAIRRVKLPELDDAFAEQIGADTLEQLKADVRRELERRVLSERNRYIEERVLDELMKRTSFELPQDLLEDVTRSALTDLERHLLESGLPEGEARANAASHSARLREDQARSIRASFLIDKIAEKERLFVTEQEIEGAVRALAAIEQRDPQGLYDELHDSGRLPGLRAQILESKVRKLLRESARVADAPLEPAGS